MEIICYRNASDIDIKFLETNNIVYHQMYSNFKKGSTKDYFLPTFYGEGILGNEKIIDENRTITKPFKFWEGMLKRCYNPKDLNRYPSYIPCRVCEEWKYLYNFTMWFNTNYYECGDEKMCLDKDILYKHNKVYSPYTSIFIPERINILFTKTEATRGNYPIGVYYKKKNKKFVAQVSKINSRNHKQQEYLGLFDTAEEAFLAYKSEKEAYIKEIANVYKKKYPHFPEEIYYALCKYTVEITD